MPARRSERAVLSPAPLESGAGESLRERIMEAMLQACGERGYREVAVKDVLEIYGGHRVQFWEQFADKEECFAVAYEAWIERLSARLLGAALAEQGWREGLRAALVELVRFVNERPAIARSLFVEVRIAGGAALAAHEAVAERCARAIDGARGKLAPEEAPPPLTGAFVVGGIENCVCDALAEEGPRRLWEELPELIHFAVAPYLGEQAAEEEFATAREAAEREGR